MKIEQILVKGLGIIGLLYLLNMGFGVLGEIVPDNLPFFGNMDEAGVAYFVDGALFNGVFNKYITAVVSIKKQRR